MILMDREEVSEFFKSKAPAKASRVLLENTESYRILNGEKFEIDENAKPSEEMKKWYDEFIETLFYGEPEVREDKPIQRVKKY